MYLVGASGHGKVIFDILRLNSQKVQGFYDKNEQLESLLGHNVYPESQIKDEDQLIISIGDNSIRKKLSEKFKNNSYGKAIHPSAVLAKNIRIGEGSVVMAGAIINIDSLIGNHAIINTSSSVDHDCIIGDYSHIAPNTTLCGGVTVGEGTLIGAGAVVIPNVKIGAWALVGAGAVVVNDVPDGACVVGNPARVITSIK
ncbi:acetyltransferase [Fulvivirga sp. RKSG066]|uniref:acetyltransferase n=1 Tax=Fulvivirga aurantia TaxID=2529383 RepID=UPI0012BD7ED6|nr:acetyltransferase [Fulvivirga aurantia]MTI19505.1 acetyltransferase [Fulvivirga aurantia]